MKSMVIWAAALTGAGGALGAKQGADSSGEQLYSHVEQAIRLSKATGLDVHVRVGDDVLLDFVLGPARPRAWDGALHAFFSVRAMQLQDEGRLELGATLASLVPEWKGEFAAVAVHELMTHTSGLPEGEARWVGEGGAGPSPERLGEFLEWLESAGFAAPHGTCYLPSSSNALLLGAALGRLERAAPIEILQRHVIGPLGLAEVQAAPAELGLAAWLGPQTLCGNARDLARALRGLARGDLIGERAWRAMSAGEELPDGTVTRFGHGLDVAALDGHARLAISGSASDTALQVAYYPAFDLCIALLGERGELDLEALERELARVVCSLPAPTLRDLPLSEAQAERFVGDYWQGCNRLSVRFVKGRLSVTLPERPPLVFLRQSEDLFLAAADRELSVQFEGDGQRANSLLLGERGALSRATRMD